MKGSVSKDGEGIGTLFKENLQKILYETIKGNMGRELMG